MTELKNRKDRMMYLQDNNNWKQVGAQELVNKLELEWGEHVFLRIVAYEFSKWYTGNRWETVGQFEVIFDGNNECLQPISNSQIADIMSKEK